MKAHEHIILEISRERERQMAVEGWSHEHDDKHDNDEMAFAAACYAIGSREVHRGIVDADQGVSATISARLWPWELRWWKPKKRRQDLVRAAALLVAEIERLDRAEARRKAA